jgi:hypothetical protein
MVYEKAQWCIKLLKDYYVDFIVSMIGKVPT